MSERFLHVVGAAILHDGRCLAAQRSATMSTPLRWEFPGGKVERDEDPRVALRRELLDELDVVVGVGEWLARGEADLPGRRICLDVYAARIAAGEVCAREHASVGWFDAAGLTALEWADPDVPVLPAVLRSLHPARARMPAHLTRSG